MASLDIGGGRGSGRRAVNADIPLVPFIDLLLCCVMFLLVTAVWNQLARIDVTQRIPGEATAADVAQEQLHFLLLLNASGYELSSTAGDRLLIPKHGADFDVGALRERLALLHEQHPSEHALTVEPDDGVAFDAVVAAMDTARSSGFSMLGL